MVFSKSGSVSSALLLTAEKLLRNKKLMRSHKTCASPKMRFSGRWMNLKENLVMINTVAYEIKSFLYHWVDNWNMSNILKGLPLNETIWNTACYQHSKPFESRYHYLITINATSEKRVLRNEEKTCMKELQVLLAVLWRVTCSKTWHVIRDLKNRQRSWFPFIQANKLKLKSMIVHYVILRLCLSTTHLESVEIFETTRIVGSLSFWNNQRNPRHIQVVYDSYVLYFWV